MGKGILAKASLAAGILLLLDGLYVAITTNLNMGTALTLAAGALLTAWGIWREKIAALTAKGFIRIVKYAVLAGVLFLLGMILFLAAAARGDSMNYKEDAVIVLGAAVHGDQASRTLSHRLDQAVQYAEKNPRAMIVVSGGRGPQEEVTEASAMERYLMDKGISKQRIVKEERATSTYENFKFSREILDKHFKGAYTCVFVTSDFHLYRARSIGAAAGLEAKGLGAKTDWYNLPPSYLRESLAVVKFWMIKR
ncbi:YdcF family protein [Anaerovorax odorimutans]|nr:YdcF family protein [Anaerovorax odorimutans]